jgi:hypothetical protein
VSIDFNRLKLLSARCALAAGLLAAALGAPAAYALPGDPDDGGGTGGGGGPICVPDPTVTAKDAQLLGTLRVLDGPLVDFDTRVTMDGAKLQLPNPKCEGKFLSVPLRFAWSITQRPAGSTAQLTQTTSLTPHLVPDKPGAWQVTFTACPTNCPVTAINANVPPITRTLNFNAVKGVEGRMSSNQLDSTLKLLLAGSRIQVSQTGAGPTVDGSQSFFDFGPIAEQNGAPADLTFSIDPAEEDVPDSVQAVLLALQGPLGIVAGTTIDKVRVKANNVHLDLSNFSKWSAGYGTTSGINLAFAFDSDHPSIECDAHYKIVALFGGVTLDEGWSDSLCPDFDLSTMDLGVTLFPTVANGQIAIASNQVSAHLVPGTDVRTELVGEFTSATGDLQSGISTKLQAKLNDAAVRAGLGLVLQSVLKHQFSDLGQIVSLQVVDGQLVVRYVSTAGQVTCAPGCLGTGAISTTTASLH